MQWTDGLTLAPCSDIAVCNRQGHCSGPRTRITARDALAHLSAPVRRAVSHKTCSRCGLRKGAAEFNNNKVSPDGLCSYCKPCNAAAAAERRRRRVPVPAPTVVDKSCSHCKEVRTPPGSFTV